MKKICFFILFLSLFFSVSCQDPSQKTKPCKPSAKVEETEKKETHSQRW